MMASDVLSLFMVVLQSVADLLYLVKSFTPVGDEAVQLLQALAVGSGYSCIDLSATVTTKKVGDREWPCQKDWDLGSCAVQPDGQLHVLVPSTWPSLTELHEYLVDSPPPAILPFLALWGGRWGRDRILG